MCASATQDPALAGASAATGSIAGAQVQLAPVQAAVEGRAAEAVEAFGLFDDVHDMLDEEEFAGETAVDEADADDESEDDEEVAETVASVQRGLDGDDYQIAEMGDAETAEVDGEEEDDDHGSYETEEEEEEAEEEAEEEEAEEEAEEEEAAEEEEEVQPDDEQEDEEEMGSGLDFRLE